MMNRDVKRKESFSGVGTVTLRTFKIGPDGKRYYEPFTKNNLIVQQGRAHLIDLLIGEGNKKKLTYIRWGNGGALAYPEGDPLNPLQVNDGDTDIGSFLLDKPLSPFQRVSPTEVQYVETLICDEVNNDVNEAAMLFEDDVTKARSLFARITFPTVRLQIQYGTGIEIRWVFNFSKAEEIPIEYEETAIETPPEDAE